MRRKQFQLGWGAIVQGGSRKRRSVSVVVKFRCVVWTSRELQQRASSGTNRNGEGNCFEGGG